MIQTILIPSYSSLKLLVGNSIILGLSPEKDLDDSLASFDDPFYVGRLCIDEKNTPRFGRYSKNFTLYKVDNLTLIASGRIVSTRLTNLKLSPETMSYYHPRIVLPSQ
mgnify:CR=1 FL=1